MKVATIKTKFKVFKWSKLSPEYYPCVYPMATFNRIKDALRRWIVHVHAVLFLCILNI